MGPRSYSVQTLSNFALEIAYDGTDFLGYAKQPGKFTVQGVLEKALCLVLGTETFSTFVSGRTDKGVHALSQVVSVSIEHTVQLDLDKLVRSLEKLTPESISVARAVVVDEGFHARFSAVERRYWYFISTSEFEIPHLRRVSWNVGSSFDLGAFFAGAKTLVGEHDFSSFCRKDLNGGSLVRRVESVGLYESAVDLFVFEIRANAFCHQMVRSIVGFLTEIARGDGAYRDIEAFMNTRCRAKGANLAPPQGLFLSGINFREPYQYVVGAQRPCPGIELYSCRS